MAHTCAEHCPIHDSLLQYPAAAWDLIVQGQLRRAFLLLLWLAVGIAMVVGFLNGFRTPIQIAIGGFQAVVTLLVLGCIVDAITHPKSQQRRAEAYFAGLRRRKARVRAPEPVQELLEPEPVPEVPQLLPTRTEAYTPSADAFLAIGSLSPAREPARPHLHVVRDEVAS